MGLQLIILSQEKIPFFLVLGLGILFLLWKVPLFGVLFYQVKPSEIGDISIRDAIYHQGMLGSNKS